MINNATASLNDVDDRPADEPANILEATDSNKELKKEQQEQSEFGKPRSKKAPNLKLKHSLISKQNIPGFNITRGKMFCRTCLKHNKKNSMTEGNLTLTEH